MTDVSAAGLPPAVVTVSQGPRVVDFELTEHLPLLREFGRAYWDRPTTDRYERWWYAEGGRFCRHVIAIDEGRCVALVSAIRKTYRIAGVPTTCLEVFDWHALPEVRGSGAGLRVMRRMMRQPHRIFAFGGTDDTLSALPAMRWPRVAEARRYELPLAGEFLAASLERRARVPRWLSRHALGLAARAWFGPRRREVIATARVEHSRVPRPEIALLYQEPSGYDIVQEPDLERLAWMTSDDAGIGRYGYLLFHGGERLLGWALTREFETRDGPEGKLVEIFAPAADARLYTWMVSEATTAMATQGVRRIRACASCPQLQAALLANRFRPDVETLPVFTWGPGELAVGRIHVTLDHADEPFLPYPAGGES